MPDKSRSAFFQELGESFTCSVPDQESPWNVGNETLGQALGPDVPVSSCFTPSHRQTSWLRKPSLTAHGSVGQCGGSELSQAWRILAVVHGQLSWAGRCRMASHMPGSWPAVGWDDDRSHWATGLSPSSRTAWGPSHGSWASFRDRGEA